MGLTDSTLSTVRTPIRALSGSHSYCGVWRKTGSMTFVCTECGGESLRWAGQCPHCRAWNTLQEFQVRKAAKDSRSRPLQPARAIPLSEIAPEDSPRTKLAWGELNRVLGGGVVPGSLVLIGGEPGVGKSTLLMHAAAQVST